MKQNLNDMKTIHDELSEDYFKSKHKLNGIDYIYITKKPIWYINREYEELVDSKGNTHSVQVGFEDEYITLDDSQFHVKGDCLKHYKLDWKVLVKFQFNFKVFLLLCNTHHSPYEVVSYLVHQFYNKGPFYSWPSELHRHKYFPLKEIVYVSGNGATLDNYIPDKMFFSIKDKERAVGMLDYSCQKRLKEDGYLEMDEIQTLKYLSNRLQEKAKFMNIYNKYRESHRY